MTAGEESRMLKVGEAIRFRGDRPHKLVNTGSVEAHATMVLVIRNPAGEDRR